MKRINERFLSYLKEKSGNQFRYLSRSTPILLLNATIHDIELTITYKLLYHRLGEPLFYSYIYQEWKKHYSVILEFHTRNMRINYCKILYGMYTKDVYVQRGKLQTLFDDIDALQIFKSLDLANIISLESKA